MFRKILFLASIVIFANSISLADEINAQSYSKQFRYFTQPEDVSGSETPYGNNPAVGRYIKSNGAMIYYEVYGQNDYGDDEDKTVFVFHGGGVGTPYEMGAIIDKLREDYRVAVVSSRGHGKSEIGHDELTYELKAKDMISVIRSITDKPVSVVGFSDGAYTAYKVAGMYPNLVRRMVTIGAGTLKSGYFEPDMKLSELEKIDYKFIEQQKALMPEPDRWQEFITKYMNFWNKLSVGKETLSAIKCPVLLIAGDEDEHAPLATMAEAHQLIPNSSLCIIPKAGHACFLDKEDMVLDIIKDFIDTDEEDLKTSKKVDYNNKYKIAD